MNKAVSAFFIEYFEIYRSVVSGMTDARGLCGVYEECLHRMDDDGRLTTRSSEMIRTRAWRKADSNLNVVR